MVPDKVSGDKIAVLRAYGAAVVTCPTAVDPSHQSSYDSVSDRLVRSDLVRLSVGIETVADLLADLEQALG